MIAINTSEFSRFLTELLTVKFYEKYMDYSTRQLIVSYRHDLRLQFYSHNKETFYENNNHNV